MAHLELPAGVSQKLYLERLFSSHDFKIEVEVLHMNEKHRSSLTAEFMGGQVNIQRGALIPRTATFHFHDPNRSLHLDNDSPFAGAMFADRLIRAIHILKLEDGTRVEVVPFIGIPVKVSREGDVLSVECQDKTMLAVEGCQPLTVKKGMNAVDAIRHIMRVRTGERHFRLPHNHKARLARSYSVGWKPESSPWAVCQRIADSINMQLVYACDGALLLRRKPKRSDKVLTITDGPSERAGRKGRRDEPGLTSAPKAEWDITRVRNIVRVTGLVNKKKHIRIGAVAKPKPKHSLSAQSLSRNDAPRWLPLLIEDASIKKDGHAKAVANDALDANLGMGITASFTGVPVFHLDYGDMVGVRSVFGNTVVPYTEATIPLDLGGDASFGRQSVTSKARRQKRNRR